MISPQESAVPRRKRKTNAFILGVGLTLILSLLAKGLSLLPFLSIMGQLVLAIILGMIYRASVGVPQYIMPGVAFSNKKLLRFGIILLGMRLNLTDIANAGPKVIVLAMVNITVTIFIVYGLARMLKVDRTMSLMTACGTGICGAAAVIAIAPLIKAKEQETAVSAATVAILGTLFTLIYVTIYPFLGLTPAAYGAFAGGTLHEVAHAIAAAAPGGKEAVDMSVIVKLTRVALLVPVSLIVGYWASRKQEDKTVQKNKVQIPWFVFGFLLMSGVNSLGIIPHEVATQIVNLSYILMAMAMAGLGLNVDFAFFRRNGGKPFVAGLLGSIVLSVMGFALVHVLGFM
ncbi:YeiH family protein [Paenibacillus sp. KQZ6P-2]|uniref:YeiH family protein n=1 Tax=Paenibacillus mangrovi TaxID=2931978 RepID=A0A9X2B408_9BACL|nr:YeiH family protein [Paenibacillus mangrovi]MCJ8013981.1 YeiH family protein [Paenibacillus mangrovi]